MIISGFVFAGPIPAIIRLRTAGGTMSANGLQLARFGLYCTEHLQN